MAKEEEEEEHHHQGEEKKAQDHHPIALHIDSHGDNDIHSHNEGIELVNERIVGKPTVIVKNLRKTFGSKTVVNDLSFRMYENQIYALLGHNGAGKVSFSICHRIFFLIIILFIFLYIFILSFIIFFFRQQQLVY
jgi:ATPase subunit of ABC transporter with duplicated ATPase domains